MNNPLFSINIVTRNRREELRRAILSVYSQKYRPIEIVVVDNASRDGTPEMVRKEWPEIRLIELHLNIGCQPGRNIGMKNCRGKYIFNLDDDGWLAPETLSLIKAEFEQDPSFFVISTRIEPPDGKQRDMYTTDYGKIRKYVANFPGGAAAFKKEVLEITGYFPEYPRGHAEADLSLRILDRGGRILYLPDAVMFHNPSLVERNNNVLRYWETRHRLETALRLEPLPYVLFDIPWKLLLELRCALANSSVKGCLRGVARFLYEVPFLIGKRKPVSSKTIQLRSYLYYRTIVDLDQLEDFKSYSFLTMIKEKFQG